MPLCKNAQGGSMKLSLRFIANKLAFSYNVEVLNEDPSVAYGTVRLFDSALSTSTKYDPIVIVPEQFDSDAIAPDFAGIIWLGANRPDTDQPTIWFKESVSPFLILDRMQNFFDMHNKWCDIVREKLLDQVTFTDVVPLLSHVTINPFYYADAGFRTLAIKEDDTLYASSSSWRMQTEIGRHPVEILSKFITSGELDEVNERHDAWLFDSSTFHTPFVSKTIFCQGDVFGHLFIVETYPDQEIFDIEILEQFGNLLEAYLNLSSLSYSSTGRPFEPLLVSQLTSAPRNASETDYLLKLLSWRKSDHYRIVLFQPIAPHQDTGSSSASPAEIQAIEDNLSSSKAFMFDDRLVCVINANKPEAISVEDTIVHLCERFGWKSALSDLGHSFDSLKSLYKRASITMQTGLDNDTVSLLYRFEDYRLDILFSTLLKNTDADFLIHDDLRALLTHDAENGSELAMTLKVYLDCERNNSRTADTLFLHRNSVNYRLDKIRSLITSDLDDPENRLFLMLSIYLWQHSNGEFQSDSFAPPEQEP